MLRTTLPKKAWLLVVSIGTLVAVMLYTTNKVTVVETRRYVNRQLPEVVRPVVVSRAIPTGGDVFEPKWTYEYLSSLCKNKSDPLMAEDLLCKKRPSFLPNYKTPCWTVARNGEERVQCMPYFHLLGVDKCGSTDLFDRILQHPEMEPVYCGLHKECFYWCWTRYGLYMKDNHEGRRLRFENYLEYFEMPSHGISLRENNGYHHHITGEGTPLDLWEFRGWPRIPQNENLEEPVIMTPHLMRHMYPDPKFIIILREPADRLYSDYLFLGYGYSPEEFHKDAIRAVDMVNTCLASNRTMRQCLFDMEMYVNLPMRIHVSCYSVVIREWLRVFPKKSFLVLRNEDYGHDIRNHMNMVFNFLNVSSLPDKEMDFISNKERKHVTQSKQNLGVMLNETKELLYKFFEPFNQELVSLLGDERFLWQDVTRGQSETLRRTPQNM